MLIVTDHIRIPMAEINFTFARSSGPGGQNVNKVSSKVILRWNIPNSHGISKVIKDVLMQKLFKQLTADGDILIFSDKYRDRNRNVTDAMEKLKKLIIQSTHIPKKRIRTRPTLSSKEKRIQTKKRHADIKSSRRKVF